MSVWTVVTVAGYGLTLLLTPFVILQRKRNSVSTLAWIMAILLVPFLGSLLFLLFGINRVARRAARKEAANRFIDQRLPGLSQFELIPGEQWHPQSQRLSRLAERVSLSRPCHGNKVEIVVDTNRTLGLIEQAVLGAQQFVNLEYYIWKPDRTGRRLRDLLISRAREGIRIRFLYDGIGSILLGRKFLRPMLDAGIMVASFLPGPTFRERWSLNLRNHRKIVIADGQIGFTGGMNIGDEYHGRDRSIGYWRDTHLCLRGPAVLQLQQVFAEDWFFATGEELTGSEWFPPPNEFGDQLAQVIAGGPDGDADALHALLFSAINEAHERISLATSYFIPTPGLQMALETAAARGVRVRLLLSARSDYPWMVTAAQAFYQSLMENGVEIYEYEYGLLHSKTMTFDGSWSLVGSANLDTRSLLLNFEAGVVLYGSKVAGQLEEQFDIDLQRATRIDPARWLRRGIHRRLGEQFLQLFSPVL